jgi:hypothetical protein
VSEYHWWTADFWSDSAGTGAKLGPVSVNCYRAGKRTVFSLVLFGRYILWPRSVKIEPPDPPLSPPEAT